MPSSNSSDRPKRRRSTSSGAKSTKGDSRSKGRGEQPKTGGSKKPFNKFSSRDDSSAKPSSRNSSSENKAPRSSRPFEKRNLDKPGRQVRENKFLKAPRRDNPGSGSGRDKDIDNATPRSLSQPERVKFVRKDPSKYQDRKFSKTNRNHGERDASFSADKRAGSNLPRPDGFKRPRKNTEGNAPERRAAGYKKGYKRDDLTSPKGFQSEYKKFDRSGISKAGKSFGAEKHTSTSAAPSKTPGPIRLNKFISNSGVCSRREADSLITMGLISVNGKVITTLGFKVNPGDEVRHESKVLHAEKPVYILMNKPKGFLTTTTDPQDRNTVMSLVSGVVKERIYPVGRLDRNTTGLLLLTNDGELAEKLMHPSYNVRKIYRVDLDRPLTKGDATRIVEGIQLEEGRAIVDDLAIVSDDGKTVGLEIHIGWNRVVRRIFESLDYKVLKLDRSVYAGLTKKDLGRGEWRFLTKEELVLLKHFK